MTEGTKRGRAAQIGGELAVALLFVALSIAMTWPMAAHLSTAVTGPDDPFVSAQILDWDLDTLLRHPASLFQLPVFYPSRDALAFTEHLFGIALVLLPFHVAGAAPITLHNIGILLGFAFCGYGAFVLGRMVTRSTIAGIAGGIFFAFLPYRFHHLGHISYVWSGWLPLLLASLLWYGRRPTWRRGIAFALVLFANGLTCLHWLAFGAVAIGATAIVIASLEGKTFRWRWWMRIVLPSAIAGVALLPLLIPYMSVAKRNGMERSWVETLPYSGTWSDWLTPARENVLWGDVTPDERYQAEHPLFPGIVVLVLAIAGMALRRRVGGWQSPKAVGRPRPTVGRVERTTALLRFARLLVSRRGNPHERDLRQNSRGLDAPDRRTWSSNGHPVAPGSRVLLALDIAAFLATILALILAVTHGIDWRIGTVRILAIDRSSIPLTLAILLAMCRLWLAYPWGSNGASLRSTIASSRWSAGVWCALLWIAIGVIGSFGLNAFFHQTLFELGGPFRGIRVPLRWSMIAFVGLSLLAAQGVAAIAERRSGWQRAAIGVVASIVLLAELRGAPVRWYYADPSTAGVYRWLATVPLKGGVLELPLSERFSDYDYLLRQRAHEHPILNGVSSFVPARYEELQKAAHSDAIPASMIDQLEALHCSIVVVHVDELYTRRSAVRAWLRDALASGRLSFVRRFDERTAGAYAFAVTKVEPDAAAWRAPEIADAASLTPSQTLNAFLERDDFTLNHGAFGYLSTPQWSQDVRGDLVIDGWALAPDGAPDVRVTINGKRIAQNVERYAAPWVTRRQPWYRGDKPGFRVTLPAAFANRTGRSDLVIELVDSHGNAARLPDVWFRWKAGRGLGSSDWNEPQLAGLLDRLGSGVVQAVYDRAITCADIGDRIVATTKQKSDEEFIAEAYRMLLDRAPSVQEARKWREHLARGGDRVELTDSLFESEEFAAKYLRPGVRMETLR
jgi:hypothetical protein